MTPPVTPPDRQFSYFPVFEAIVLRLLGVLRAEQALNPDPQDPSLSRVFPLASSFAQRIV